MFGIAKLCLAFAAGATGTVVGGTQAFIIYGLLCLFTAAMQVAGVDLAFMNDWMVNLYFMPCVMFGGAVFATPYAAIRFQDIEGQETGKALAKYRAPMVLAVGGIGGVIGYVVWALAVLSGIQMDQGAFSVVIGAAITRLLWYRGLYFRPEGTEEIRTQFTSNILFPLLLAAVVSYPTALAVRGCGMANIGFALSAALLLFCYLDPAFPATHHTTLVAGYAMAQTGSIALAIVFGVLAQLVCSVFERYFNVRCKTHFDPPAVAIVTMSLVIFNLF